MIFAIFLHSLEYHLSVENLLSQVFYFLATLKSCINQVPSSEKAFFSLD